MRMEQSGYNITWANIDKCGDGLGVYGRAKSVGIIRMEIIRIR